MAQVALAWLVDRPTVTSVILGARTREYGGPGTDPRSRVLARMQRRDRAVTPTPTGTPATA